MSGVVTAVAVVGAGSAYYSSKKAGDASDKASKRTSETAAQSEALNVERFDEAQQMLSPYIQRSDIAQRQLMSELGLPVPSVTPYMQRKQDIVSQEGAEASIRETLKSRKIPEFITTEKYVPAQGGRGGRPARYAKVNTPNPEYEAAYQDELANLREIDSATGGQGQQAERTTGMGMDAAGGVGGGGPTDQPIEGEYIQAPGTGYRATPSYQNLMGMYDEYEDVIGTPSYDAIQDPIREYQELVKGDAVSAPLRAYEERLGAQGEDPLVAYQRMIDEGVDVTNLPGYQKMIEERLSAAGQSAAGAGSLYSGRRLEAAGEVGGATEREFSRDYMNRQGDVASRLSSLQQGNLDRYGNVATAMSNVESGRLNRRGKIASAFSVVAFVGWGPFGVFTFVKAGTENQFYSNYMNMLQNMASPQVAQNLSALGVNQGMAMGQQNIGAQTTASNYNLQGVGAQNAAIADLSKGAANIATAYMNRPQQPNMVQNAPMQQPMIIPQQAGYTNPNYSPAQGSYSPVQEFSFTGL